jgi:hypothetical protein
MFYSKQHDLYINKLNNGEHFKYSRFNNGEIIAASRININGSNCDNHKYFPEMGNELEKILLNYSYSDTYVFEHYKHWYNTNNLVHGYLDNIYQQNKNLKFLDDDFIRKTHEIKPYLFIDLIESFRDKKIVIIGADYLKSLNKFFDFEYIEIPRLNCYLSKDKIISDIKERNKKEDNNIYLFSASMATNIIIDEFKEDNNNSYIDWGSVWDTFFIGKNYSYLRKRSSSNMEIYKNYYNKYLIL